MVKFFKKKERNYARIAFLSIFLILAGFMIFRGLGYFGKISFKSDLIKYNYFISSLTPTERISIDKTIKIIADPVYFTLKTLRPFSQAKITFEYRSNNVPIIEAGILADGKLWRYATKPLQNFYLDKLSREWFVAKENGLLLLQRQKEGISLSPPKYLKIKDFLNNLPDIKEIALYNYNLTKNIVLNNYSASDQKRTINVELRGAYEFYTYIKKEDLDITFKFSDINKNKDKDTININIYFQDKLIDSQTNEDLKDFKKEILEKRNDAAVLLKNMPEGFYKIEVKANDDIITNEMITKQNKLSFKNKLWIHKISAPIALITDSEIISAQTVNPSSKQVLDFNGHKINIEETYKQYNLVVDPGLKEAVLSKGDVILSGDRMWSLSKNDFVQPEFKRINYNFDPEGINYILARYEPNSTVNGWNKTTLTFDLPGSYSEKEKGVIPGFNLFSRRYSFIISAPGLRTDDGTDDHIEIKNVRVELSGKKFWEYLK